MTFVTGDRTRETTTTTGTASFALAGPVVGYQAFSALGNGNTTAYVVPGQGTGEWETGIGTVSTGSLSRDVVLSSSNGGAKVNFSAGVKDVFCAPPASLVGLKNQDNTWTGAQSMPAPSADAHAARRQDIGWERIAGPVAMAGATSCAVTIPTWARNIQILGGGLSAATATVQDVWVQVQVNGSWVTSGAGKYYESGIYMPSDATSAPAHPINDRNGQGLFFTRFDQNSVGGGESVILNANDTVITLKTSMGRGYGMWGGTAGWTQWSSAGLVVTGAFRIEAVRLINTTASPVNFASGYMTVLGTRG